MGFLSLSAPAKAHWFEGRGGVLGAPRAALRAIARLDAADSCPRGATVPADVLGRKHHTQLNCGNGLAVRKVKIKFRWLV